jgi:hypothetical protein
MNLNDVKAGKYQLVAVRWDKITSKPGEPLDYERYRRGDLVDLNVEDAKRLVAAGAVVKPGQLERTAAEQAKAIAERAAADYQAVLAGLPEDVRKEVAPDTVSAEPEPPKPPKVADVLKDVGDDAEKAKAALAAEQALGEGARSTLVTGLEAIIAKADQGNGGS